MVGVEQYWLAFRKSSIATKSVWWTLLSGEYNRSLWQPCLVTAFDGPVRRQRLHTSLPDVRQLRSRIAHNEPIHHRDLQADYRRLLDTAGRIAQPLRTHLEATSRLPARLAARPPSR